MTMKEKIKKLINDVNPKLEKFAGAKMDLVKIDDENSEVFIKVEATKNQC